MTAIAFKDGILAADSGLFSEDHIIVGRMNKIIMLDKDWYLAMAGDCADSERVEAAMRERLESESNKPWNIPFDEWQDMTTECSGVLVSRRKQVFQFKHNTGIEHAGHMRAIAHGACETYLMGLMDAGLDAGQAVARACVYHALCKEPVNVVQVW